MFARLRHVPSQEMYTLARQNIAKREEIKQTGRDATGGINQERTYAVGYNKNPFEYKGYKYKIASFESKIGSHGDNQIQIKLEVFLNGAASRQAQDKKAQEKIHRLEKAFTSVAIDVKAKVDASKVEKFTTYDQGTSMDKIYRYLSENQKHTEAGRSSIVDNQPDIEFGSQDTARLLP
ncbi:hypothetical protein SOPP22_00400 [Shewanella sp. OPT22]|nr:hypothetical protein SOPP22_00400 [Shewanella sp. OPT22]